MASSRADSRRERSGVTPSDQPVTGLKAAKLAFLRQAERAGLFQRVRDSAWRASKLLIVGYHGVSLGDEHLWNPELYISADALAQRLDVLRDGGYSVLPLHEAVARLYDGTLPPRAVSLTFDDGTCDFYLAALPLLRERGFPATVYLTTYYAERAAPVFQVAVRYLLWRGRHLTISGEGLTAAGGPLPLATLDERDRATDAITGLARHRRIGIEGEAALMRIIAERVGVDYGEFLRQRKLQLMTPDELRAVVAAGMDVQLHTHRHRVPLDRGLFLREIDDNRRYLRTVLGPDTRHDHFCYPSGVTDPAFLDWLAEAGVQSATTCDVGLAHRGSHPLLLPRLIDGSYLTAIEFEGWATGVSRFLPRRPYRPRYRPRPARAS